MRVAISTKIEAKLNEQVGVGKLLKVVYNEHKIDVSGYPAATYEPSDVESDYESTTQNWRKYVFRVMIHQQFETISKGEAIDRINAVVDILISEFEKDYTLTGTVDKLEIGVSADGDYDKGTTPIHYAELIIEAYKSIDIT